MKRDIESETVVSLVHLILS